MNTDDISMPKFDQTPALIAQINIAVARALRDIPEPLHGSIPMTVGDSVFGADDYHRMATQTVDDLLPVGGAYGWLTVVANSLQTIASMDPVYGTRHHSLLAMSRALMAIQSELEKQK